MIFWVNSPLRACCGRTEGLMTRQGWHSRIATVQAMLLLLLAQQLIARVPLARWRRSLGVPTSQELCEGAERLDRNLPARRLARAVEHAAEIMPGDFRCLPRAVALQWMLKCHRIGSVIYIGVLRGPKRGDLHDLHAWVVRGGEVLIGGTGAFHGVLYGATTERGVH